MAYPTELPAVVTANVNKIKATWANNMRTLMVEIFTRMGYVEEQSPAGYLLNGKLSVTVATNDLTVAIKTLAGDDPSATDPVRFRIDDVEYELTAALSVTSLDATNWANLGSTEFAAKEVDLFAYLINETGGSAGVKLGWARISFGTVVGDFSSTTTEEYYLAGPTNYNATDKVQLIGRFNAILGVSATYIWSLPATQVIINHPILNTRPLLWQPVYSANADMTYTDVTTDVAEYQLDYRKCTINLQAVGTVGGTPSTTLCATLPFIGRNAAYQPAMTAWIANTSAEASFAFIDNAVTRQIAFRRTASSAWTAGANKYINSGGSYLLA